MSRPSVPRPQLLVVALIALVLGHDAMASPVDVTEWTANATGTVLFREDFNAISSSTWPVREYFTAQAGVAQCVGPQRSSNCTLTTAREFDPGIEIETRMKVSGGCNCGFVGLRFGIVGQSMYELRAECDAWGLDCAKVSLYKWVNGQAGMPVHARALEQVACLSWYRVKVVWRASSLDVTINSDSNDQLYFFRINGDFNRRGRIGVLGYDCDGGSAVDFVEVRNLESTSSAALTVGEGSACGGSSTVIPINVSGAEGMVSAQFDLVFDNTKLALSNVTTGSMTPAFSVSSNAVSSGRVRVAMASGTAANGSSGEIARVTVVPASTFTTGQSASIQIQNATVNDRTATGSQGLVSCTNACKLGDVNDNGSVTALDASLILQAVVGSRNLSSRETCAADYNQNGNVTSLDASQVLQCVVGSGPCR